MEYGGKVWELNYRPWETHGPEMRSSPFCGVKGRNVKTSCWHSVV